MTSSALVIQPHKIDGLPETNNRVVASVNQLLRELTTTPRLVNNEILEEIVNSDSVWLFLARLDDIIVGMFTIAIYSVPTRKTMVVEDVVVAKEFWRRGIGEAMTEMAIHWAEQRRVDTIDLTSRPDRLAANAMYIKKGFIRRTTNVYRYDVLARKQV